MSMTAEKSRVPNQRGSLHYSPNTTDGGSEPWGTEGEGGGSNSDTLAFDGEIQEEWIITGVPQGTQLLDVAKGADGLPLPSTPMDGHSDWLVARLDGLCNTAAVDKNNANEETWRCTIIYVPDPSQKPTEVYYSSNRVMQVVSCEIGDDNTYSGKAIVNGAGDPYNPQVQEARSTARVKIVKRYLRDGFDGTIIQKFPDMMSSADWEIPGLGTVPKGDAFCSMIEAPLVKEPIWHIQAEFHFDIDVSNMVTIGDDDVMTDVGFNQALLNCGYQFINSNGKKVLFASDEGVAHGGIGLLNENGTKADPATPVYDLWKTKPKVDFNDLGLFS